MRIVGNSSFVDDPIMELLTPIKRQKALNDMQLEFNFKF